MASAPSRSPGRSVWLSALIMSISIVAAAAIIGYVLVRFKIIPTSYQYYIYGLIWLIAAVMVTHIISGRVRAALTQYVGPANASSVALVVRVAGYTIAFIGFLAIIRISVPEALAAGGFAGLVVGLGAQYALSNVIGGIIIVLTRPYRVGDRITFTTWQYGLLAPAYPPKFFSQDFLIPGYTGVVKEINLMYTVIQTDDNVPVKVPNSIMVQAAIFVHSDSEVRRVRTKYEVPKELDPDLVLPAVAKSVKELSVVVGEPDVKILDTSQTTYVIAVDAMCKTIDEEPARSEIIKAIMRTIKELRSSAQPQAGKA